MIGSTSNYWLFFFIVSAIIALITGYKAAKDLQNQDKTFAILLGFILESISVPVTIAVFWRYNFDNLVTALGSRTVSMLAMLGGFLVYWAILVGLVAISYFMVKHKE